MLQNTLNNPFFSADSYKFSHFYQYNSSIQHIYDYYENRGNETVYFFGLRYYIEMIKNNPLTPALVDTMESYAKIHGIPFYRKGFDRIVNEFDGLPPVTIRSVPESASYPSKLPLFTIENTHTDFAWVVGMLETMLMKVWYPSAVATKAKNVKESLKPFFEETSEAPEIAINYAYHNFGARGSATEEQAVLGGIAHLTQFNGTDNFKSVMAAEEIYSITSKDKLSIPATEHSTTTSEGRENEYDFLLRYVTNTVASGYKLMAAVMDSYDYFQTVQRVIGRDSEIRELLEANNAKLVLRPDSGDQIEILKWTAQAMKDAGVVYLNNKGFFTSNVFSVIWGDGVNPETIKEMARVWVEEGMSMDILAFGSGGDLMQNVTRDTHKTAIKASSALYSTGKRLDVFKDPVTDKGKTSKKGRVVTCRDENGEFYVGNLDSDNYNVDEDYMDVVYSVGE